MTDAEIAHHLLQSPVLLRLFLEKAKELEVGTLEKNPCPCCGGTGIQRENS